jgi:hypothetical protein
MIGFWFSQILDRISNCLYPNDITDEFWDGDEDDN